MSASLKPESIAVGSSLVVVYGYILTAGLLFDNQQAIGKPMSYFQDFQSHADFYQYKDYTYTGMRKVGRGEDGLYTELIFVPPYDAATMSKPYLKIPSVKDHPWDAVITGIKVRENRSFQEATNGISRGVTGIPRGTLGIVTRPTYTLQLYGLPAINRSTLIYEWRYLSSQKFKIGTLNIPVPEMMHLIVSGRPTVVESSLHNNIDLPSMTATTDSSFGGNSAGGGGRVAGYRSKKTNFTKREPYFFAVSQEMLENGMFDMRRYLAYPPEGTKPERIQ